ncbi:MAG: ribonuclease E/G [Selenomonadaceae bacterium]|nr:ribonuclease E/G [Selenomonadaceae bacterium]
MKRIIISRKGINTRAVVLSDDEIESIYTEQEDAPRLVGNIYKGRVQNFLPGMRAAFVDIGRDKNAFLQFNAAQKFSVGQSVLIQIEKDAIGTKGARATLNVSVPGQFLIYLPNQNYIGVSNKIRGEERERLHLLAKSIRDQNGGLIVRTAAEGASEDDLIADLNGLQKIWANILERYPKRKAPALLFSDNDLIEKILRDEFAEDITIVVDNIKIERQLCELISPDKITFYDGTENIFDAYGLTAELDCINKRELDLPSGGQIVIDRTEALTAIDVNTGKFIGHGDFAKTILKTNLEAAKLILRQLRLRDISGIIIVDFIDMLNESDKKTLMDYLHEQAHTDRNRVKVIDMTPLGLVELTRRSSRH